MVGGVGVGGFLRPERSPGMRQGVGVGVGGFLGATAADTPLPPLVPKIKLSWSLGALEFGGFPIRIP